MLPRFSKEAAPPPFFSRDHTAHRGRPRDRDAFPLIHRFSVRFLRQQFRDPYGVLVMIGIVTVFWNSLFFTNNVTSTFLSCLEANISRTRHVLNFFHDPFVLLPMSRLQGSGCAFFSKEVFFPLSFRDHGSPKGSRGTAAARRFFFDQISVVGISVLCSEERYVSARRFYRRSENFRKMLSENSFVFPFIPGRDLL